MDHASNWLTGFLVGLITAVAIIFVVPLLAAESISLANWVHEASALTQADLETTP